MAGILPRTALAAATLALLAMSGAMAIEEPQDVTEIVQEDVPVVDSPAKASMSHARGGLNAAVAGSVMLYEAQRQRRGGADLEGVAGG